MSWGFAGKQDVYIEIAERYEQYILKGIYKNGDKLPSVRVAGQELGVNPNTVARAYALLVEKGYVCSLPKKGAFVTYGAIYNNHETKDACKKAILELKELGITYDDFVSLAKEVFEVND